ncbi:MAG: 2-oxoacid:acceptor oxidoreductase family protein [Vulcanimicrobiota bacterium]
MIKKHDIYVTGVGGQGIGLLSEVLIRAADHAGFPVKGVDTHGLAQRGGIVASHVRIGRGVHSPLIAGHSADTVIALERNEAYRGLLDFLAHDGTLVYYNTVWQPLAVRLGKEDYITEAIIEEECVKRSVKVIKVFQNDLADVRMQNTVLLAAVARKSLIEGVLPSHFITALEDLLEGSVLENNRALFTELTGGLPHE